MEPCGTIDTVVAVEAKPTIPEASCMTTDARHLRVVSVFRVGDTGGRFRLREHIPERECAPHLRGERPCEPAMTLRETRSLVRHEGPPLGSLGSGPTYAREASQLRHRGGTRSPERSGLPARTPCLRIGTNECASRRPRVGASASRRLPRDRTARVPMTFDLRARPPPYRCRPPRSRPAGGRDRSAD